MEIVKPQRGTTWTGILTGMMPGQSIPASMKDRNTVAPLISGKLKLSHPNMEWKTKKVNDSRMEIIRIK